MKGKLKGGDPVHSKTIGGYIGEGVIAQDLGALQDRYQMLEIGSYPFFRQGKFGASFVIRGTDTEKSQRSEELRAIIVKLGAEPSKAKRRVDPHVTYRYAYHPDHSEKG